MLERIANIAKQSVVYNGEYLGDMPWAVFLSPSLAQKFICVDNCTACCLPFTLDYLPSDTVPSSFVGRSGEVNGQQQIWWSYPQQNDLHCPHLKSGKCGLWPHAPLECAAAPNLHMDSVNKWTYLKKRPYHTGPKWDPPAQCFFSEDMVDWNYTSLIDLLLRYQQWSEFFEIETHIPRLLAVIPDTFTEWKAQVNAGDTPMPRNIYD